jgi:NADH dehydrogenase FAD-containing subunit
MKHLVMLGAGDAHLHLLSTLVVQPPASVQITLVTPHPMCFYPNMAAGYVAGHTPLEDCTIKLAGLLQGSGVNWMQRSVTKLDAAARHLTLDDDSTLEFDVLSISTGPLHDRQKIEQTVPGAREHAVFAYPCEALGTLWPQVLAFAENRALRVAVIGAGKAAIELALAVAQRLKGSSVTLLTGNASVVSDFPPAVQARVLRALKRHHITLISEPVSGIAAGVVKLGHDTQLACDVPLIAIDAQPPAWLQGSRLALNEQGFVLTDAFWRATSHPQVFAAADVSTRSDHQALEKNLRAVLAGVTPDSSISRQKTLRFVTCSDRSAIASWGNLSAQGRWVEWLKHRIDRGFVQQHRQPASR